MSGENLNQAEVFAIKMLIFLTIVVLCLIFQLMPELIKLFHIQDFMRTRSQKYSAELQQQLNIAQEELERVREMRTTEQYSYTIKVLRAEENVKEIKTNMRKERNLADLKSATVVAAATYCAKGLISLILLIISIKNRHTPVMRFDESLNFEPLTGLLSFPTGVLNAISVPIWVLSCNVTFRFVNNLIKSKK